MLRFLSRVIDWACRVGGAAAAFGLRKSDDPPGVGLAGELSEIDELKRELARSRELLEKTQSMAKLGFWEYRPATQEIFWSDYSYEVFGLNPRKTEITDDLLESFVHPDDLEGFIEARSRIPEQGMPSVIDFRVIVDGGVKDLRMHAVVEKAADGTIERLLGTTQDVTEQHIAETARQRSEKMLKNAQRIAKIGSWEWDLVTDQRVWSDEMSRIYGLEPQPAGTSYKVFLDAIYASDHAVIENGIRALLDDGVPYCVVYRIARSDGKFRYVEEQAEVVRDDSGSPTQVSGTVQDITDRRVTEIALNESQQQLADAQAIARVGHFNIPIGAERAEWSPALTEIFGLGENEQVPTYKEFLLLVHPDDLEGVKRNYEELVAGEASESSSFRVILDGAIRHIQVRQKLERDANGEVSAIFGTFQDITQSKETEIALTENRAILERAQSIAHIGHWEFWTDLTRRAEWSDECKRIFGIPPENDAPEFGDYLERIHEDDRERVSAGVDDLIAGKDVPEMNYRLMIDGAVKYVNNRNFFHRDEKGAVQSVFGTIQDVTHTRETEIFADKNKALLERAQSIAKIGSWDWDIVADELTWSDEIYRIFGLEPQSSRATYDTFLSHVHPDDRSELEKAVQMALDEDVSYKIVHRVVRPTGEIRYVEEQAEVSRDAGGRPFHMTGTVQDVTARRHVETELRKNEALLDDAQKLANMGHWEFNVALNEGYWSDSIYPMLGYKKGEVQPSSAAFQPLLHPDDQKWFVEYEAELAEKGVRPVLDFRAIINGQTRHIQMRSHEDRDETGNLLRIYGTTQDVTEMKTAEEQMRKMNANLEMRVNMRTAELTAEVSERTKAEDQLRVQKEFSEQLVNVAEVGIVVLDNDGKVLRMNRYLEDVTGYSLDEVEGESWFEFMLPDFERSRIKGVFDESVQGSNASGTINAIRAKSGKLRYMEWSDAPLKGIDNEPIGLLAIGQDVTQRLRDQAQIFELSRRNEQILEAAGEGIYGVDLDGICTFINTAGCQMLGVSGDDIIGLSAHDAIHHTRADGSHYDAADCPISEAFTDGMVQTISDEVFWRADGAKFPVEYTSTPIIEDGRITGAVVVFRDTSDARLMQQQVIQTSKLATLGEMATGVAHEINQPLNIIRMAAGNVRKKLQKGDIDPAYVVDKLERIDAQTRRAAEIIDHMRVFGRKSDTIPVPVDPVLTANSALAMVSQQLKLANIEMETELAPACGMVMGHQVQLEQVMLNLIGNARHELEEREDSKNGGGRIRFVVRPVPSEAPKSIEIIVADNAGGIPDDVLPRIFEPFFTTKGIGEGTGLGLSISYGIVSDMDGMISAHNDTIGAESGAVFTITLPLAEKAKAR